LEWLRDFNGRCNLRMDDTNPLTEDMRYVEALKMQWSGWDLGGVEMFATPPTTSLNSMGMVSSLLRWEKPMWIV